MQRPFAGPVIGSAVLVAGISIAAAAAILPGSGTVGLAAMVLFGLCVGLALRTDRPLQLIIITAFALRAVAALEHAYGAPLPDSSMDAVGFQTLAVEWSNGGLRAVLAHFSIGAFTYAWLISLLYLLLAPSQLLAQSVNVLLGSLVVLNVYKLSLFYFDRHTALRTAWVAAFFPSLVLYSSITMREVFVTFPMTLGLLYFSRWTENHSIFNFIFGTVCFLIAGTFHYAILMVCAVVIAVFFIKSFFAAIRERRAIQIILQGFVGIVILPIVLYAILNFQTDFGKLSNAFSDLPTALKLVQRVMESRSEGRLAYLQNVEVTTLWDAIYLTPVRVVYFLFSPFPWALPGASDAFLSLDGCLYVVFVVAALVTWMRGRARRSPWPVLAAIVTLVVIFSFGTSNSGTAFRHRGKIAPLFISMSASLVSRRRPDRYGAFKVVNAVHP